VGGPGGPGVVMSPQRPRTAAPVDTIIIIDDDQLANVPAMSPLNATWRASVGVPGGQFGTRTSPERPRFRALLELGAELAILISHAQVATYVKTEAVSLP
jgi:hypothetical protein